MVMIECPKCHVEYFESHKHTCPPQWLVWNPDQGETREDARPIYARDAEAAVEKWAEQDDNGSAEYSIAKGHAAVVHVLIHRPEDFGPIPARAEKFKVYGQYEPIYWAEKIE
jgi:hypothetical protein